MFYIRLLLIIKVNILTLFLSFKYFQAKEGESDPLITVGNGNEVVIDTIAPKAPGWDSNKDLHA